MTPAGTLITLYTFPSSGGFPAGLMIPAASGIFYGTTPGDGATNDDGTVFSFAIGLVGLPPPLIA